MPRLFDWHQLHRDTPTPAVVDPRRRLRVCMAAFALLLLLVFGRAVQLELTQGAAFRAEALAPLRRETILPATRGRILARDGSVLACDKQVLALAVHYRWLEDPPDPQWLRETARKRLSKAERKDARRLAEEETRLREQRADLTRRLVNGCGLSPQQWADRTGRIQDRVQRIAASANRRREEGSPPITVKEELQHHVVAEDLPAGLAAEIEGQPERCPGVQVLRLTRRAYPAGTLAAHALGHLGPWEGSGDGEASDANDDPDYQPNELVGRMGVERRYEDVLRGRPGLAVELTDHGGRVLSTFREREPTQGGDLTLTLDCRLQRTAEELLDSVQQRRNLGAERPEPAGGAAVVMDIHSGAILAAASAPRFDPGLFVRDDAAGRAAVLADPAHPLFDRVARMAMSVGQSSPAVTPLQMARLMAAVANGGKLVRPHVVERIGTLKDGKLETYPTAVSGLHPSTLAELREALQRAVADPQGVAHASVCLESMAVAGKTGTAATGKGRAEHAWFVGYVPADQPRYVLVVALEHSGDAAATAGPVAKRLVVRMQELGLL